MESPASDASCLSSRLDALEARVLGVLGAGHDEAAWRSVLDDLDRAEAEENTEIYAKAPPIDPSEGRRSTCELRCLIDVLRGLPPRLPPPRTRAGYALEGATLGETQVLPAFVAALGAKGLRAAFPDLWAIDAALWDRLDEADPRELARLWLQSPGRRFVQDIGALAHTPREAPLGPTVLSRERILAAAGVPLKAADPAPNRRSWRELHLAIPGAALDAWEPEPAGKAEQIAQALRLLEEGSPLGLRGAALAWLLRIAAGDPVYSIADGVRRDLRDELPMRLSTALPDWLRDDLPSTVPCELETLALRHAARLMAGDDSEEAPQHAWAVARWLQGCLRRSPFFGSDEETLAAHLRSLLPAEPLPVPEDADALHPSRFSLGESGLDVAEIAFIGGLITHYQQRAHEETLLPTPVPLVRALQRLASHSVHQAEEGADAALSAGHNALGWPSEVSIAPPLAARRLMTDLKIGWIAQAGEAAQVDSIDRFATDPVRNAWVAFALHREGQHLGPRARERAIAVFDALTKAKTAQPHVLGTLGTGLLEGLPEDADALRILELAKVAEVPWRPFVADALAGAAEPLDRQTIWTAALEALLTLMADTGIDDKTRLNAALFALRRASASKRADRGVLIGRISTLSSAAPFSDHLGLRREIRRLGLPGTAAAGSKR